jgi:acetylornithine deacetylase/succinyl-diaminopimelate desuccinylase-like protein
MTCELVRMPSISDARGGDELLVQRQMAEWFDAAGARVRTFEPRDVPEFFTHPLCYSPSRQYDNRPTVLAEIGPQDAPALLVLAHSDTVPLFEPEKWTVEPFGGEVRDGRIYGLGCSDDKWGLAAMVMIARALQPAASGLKKRVIFASTVDEESGVGNAGGLEVGLAALGNRARIAVVALAVGGLDHIAGEEQRRLVGEGVHMRGIGIRHQRHIGRLDALPARDRGTIEEMAVAELGLAERRHRYRHVLLLAASIGEAEVDELHLVVLDHL